MKKQITKDEFINEFLNSDYKDNFTIDGLIALYDWIAEYDYISDTETDLDIIALCCDFSEYKDLNELKSLYSYNQNIQNIQNIDELFRYFNIVISVNNTGIIIPN